MINEQLVDIENYAGFFFTKEEVQIILNLLDAEINTAQFTKAYLRGKLIAEATIRKSIIELAANGSSPAQIIAMKFIDQSKLDV